MPVLSASEACPEPWRRGAPPRLPLPPRLRVNPSFPCGLRGHGSSRGFARATANIGKIGRRFARAEGAFFSPREAEPYETSALRFRACPRFGVAGPGSRISSTSSTCFAAPSAAPAPHRCAFRVTFRALRPPAPAGPLATPAALRYRAAHD